MHTRICTPASHRARPILAIGLEGPRRTSGRGGTNRRKQSARTRTRAQHKRKAARRRGNNSARWNKAPPSRGAQAQTRLNQPPSCNTYHAQSRRAANPTADRGPRAAVSHSTALGFFTLVFKRRCANVCLIETARKTVADACATAAQATARGVNRTRRCPAEPGRGCRACAAARRTVADKLLWVHWPESAQTAGAWV